MFDFSVSTLLQIAQNEGLMSHKQAAKKYEINYLNGLFQNASRLNTSSLGFYFNRAPALET